MDELCISSNGGKDCTVLSLILQAAQNKLTSPDQQLRAPYIYSLRITISTSGRISETTKRYNLNLITRNGNIKDALKTLKETQPSVKAILLGTRRHDPFSDVLRTFSPTDPDWPHYMRVNLILDWHHADVWSFIRECDVPYCVASMMRVIHHWVAVIILTLNICKLTLFLQKI